MNHQKKWSVDSILRDINACFVQVSSPYNDGYNAWACKKDLYTILFHLEDILEKSPKFSDVEQEHLREREHTKLLQRLQN